MNSEPSTLADETLVVHAMTGDDDAFNQLVQRYFGRIYVIAYARLGSREEAEDLTQEVFIRIYLNLGQADPVRKFSHWICRIAHNLACDWLRRRKHRSQLLFALSLDGNDEMAKTIADPQAPDARDKMAEEQKRELLQKAILRLPPDMREVILLQFAERLSNKDIAEHLGVHPSTVGRLEKKALALLKIDLQPMRRDLLGEFLPSRRATARTFSALAAVAALSFEAKSALARGAASLGNFGSAASQSVSAGPGIARWVKSVAHSAWQMFMWLTFPFRVIFLSKPIAIILLAMMVIGAVYLAARDNGLDFHDLLPKTAAQPPAPLAASAPPVSIVPSAISAPAAPAATPAMIVTPAASAPVRIIPAQPPPPLRFAKDKAPNRGLLLQQAARQAGVRIVKIQPQRNGALVTVQWPSGGATDRGGAFMEQAVRNGAIQNFSAASTLGGTVKQGQRVYRGQYKINY